MNLHPALSLSRICRHAHLRLLLLLINMAFSGLPYSEDISRSSTTEQVVLPHTVTTISSSEQYNDSLHYTCGFTENAENTAHTTPFEPAPLDIAKESTGPVYEHLSSSDGEDGSVSEDESENNEDCLTCNGLEASIIRETGNDLVLAAQLMPILHSIAQFDAHGGITYCAPSTGEGSTFGSTSYNASSSGNGDDGSSIAGQKSSGSPNKQDDNDQRDGRNSKRKLRSDENESGMGVGNLACPFNKHNPGKYNGLTSNPKYRTCQGPGFTQFRYLKLVQTAAQKQVGITLTRQGTLTKDTYSCPVRALRDGVWRL